MGGLAAGSTGDAAGCPFFTSDGLGAGQGAGTPDVSAAGTWPHPHSSSDKHNARMSDYWQMTRLKQIRRAPPPVLRVQSVCG